MPASVGLEDSEWGRRYVAGGHLCTQCSSVCDSSLYSGHVGSGWWNRVIKDVRSGLMVPLIGDDVYQNLCMTQFFGSCVTNKLYT